MRNFENNFGIYLLLWAFFAAFGNQGYACSQQIGDLHFEDYNYLQAGQHTQGLLFEQIATSGVPTAAKELPNSGFIYASSSEAFYVQNTSVLQTASVYLQDKKTILEHQIFPFHFFW